MGARVRFDFALIASRLPDIFHALGVTLLVWIVSLAGACLLGFVVAVARRFGPRWLDWILSAYVELFRGTPFLIQLFLLYFGGPYAGLSLDAIPAGIVGLSVYGAAYFSEIFRSGFEAVPPGHVEAAECSGLNRAQILRRILLPEMTMLVLPSSINMAVIVLKALTKSSTDRYATVDGLHQDLRRFLGGEPVAARPDRPHFPAGGAQAGDSE